MLSSQSKHALRRSIGSKLSEEHCMMIVPEGE